LDCARVLSSDCEPLAERKRQLLWVASNLRVPLTDHIPGTLRNACQFQNGYLRVTRMSKPTGPSRSVIIK
jgi:hypothetical protein